MLFHVNPSSGVPIYAQIEIQVKNAIAAGAVKQGQALPSVRKLAAELGINPTTTARAYQNLERDGVITTIPGGNDAIALQILIRSEEHTSELQSPDHLVCRLLLEKKKTNVKKCIESEVA